MSPFAKLFRRVTKLVTFFFLLVTYGLVTCDLCYAAVRLKIAVVNPSEAQEQTTPVRYDLPKGVGPEDIEDIGSLQLGYDLAKGSYYVYGTLTLKPSEKIVLEVKLRDMWMIQEKDIDLLSGHTDSLAKKLDRTKHYSVGSALSKKIKEELDEISKKQSSSGLMMGERINIYYENKEILRQAKEDIGMLENLVIDVGGIVEDRVQVPSTMVVSLGEDEAASPQDTVELTVRVTNPSADKEQAASVKYLLPEEVSPRYVVDADGLDLGYDFGKECFYVYKDDLKLKPAESMAFNIKIKNIWRVGAIELEGLRSHTNNIMVLLKGTEYLAQAAPIADKIFLNLGKISASQTKNLPVKEHIARYRDNSVILKETKQHLAQLEKIATQSGASPGVTIARAEILKGGGEKARRQRGYEGIDLIARTIFRGKAPDVATTWRVIFVVIGFIGVIGGLFFARWYRKDRGQGSGDRGQGSGDRGEKQP